MNIKIFSILVISAFMALPASGQKLLGKGNSEIYTVPDDPDAIRIHPYLRLKIGYDSNVLLDQSNEEEDDIFGQAQIGLRISRPIGLLKLGANASVTTEKYLDVSEADDTDVNLDLNVGLNLDEEAFIGTRDTIQVTLDVDLYAGERVNDETGTLEDTQRAGASINVGKTLDNILGDVDLQYSASKTEYDNRDGNLQQSIRGSVAPILSPTTALTLSSTYSTNDSENDTNDGGTWNNQVGIRKTLTDKTKIAASAGYATSEIGDAETFSYNLNGTWLATEKTQLRLTASSSISPSNSQDDTASIRNTGRAEMLLAHNNTLTSRFTVNLTKIELERESRKIQDEANGEGGDDLARRLSTGTDSDTITLGYDLVYGPRELNYNLFWETEYQVREEDTANNEYDDFITAVGILLHY